MSIDTESVIYTENGPNFHTYTFKIGRKDALPSDPLENLVLIPLTDGNYKELLISYELSMQEKNILMNGGFVDTKGKTTITELAQGTFINGMKNNSLQSCGWGETYTYVSQCSENQHGSWNTESWESCEADVKPGWHTTVMYICESVYDENDTGGGSTHPSNPSDGGGGNSCPDCPSGGNSSTPSGCVEIPTGPLEPTGGMGENGCGTAIPTIPNLPSPSDDPCENTKTSITAADTVLKDPTVQSQMDATLKGKIAATKEFAMKIGDNGNSTYSFSNLVEGAVSSVDLNDAVLASGVLYMADGHTHAGGFGNPSGGDLYGFLENILTTNQGLKYRYVYGNNFGVPEIYALVLNDKSVVSDFLSQYPRSENYDPETHGIKLDSKLGLEFYKAHNHHSEGRSENTSGENYASGAVAMAYILDKLNIGVTIAHIDASGNLKKINASVAEIIVPLSGGKKKEGVKVSKCP